MATATIFSRLLSVTKEFELGTQAVLVFIVRPKAGITQGAGVGASNFLDHYGTVCVKVTQNGIVGCASAILARWEPLLLPLTVLVAQDVLTVY